MIYVVMDADGGHWQKWRWRTFGSTMAGVDSSQWTCTEKDKTLEGKKEKKNERKRPTVHRSQQGE